MEAGVSPSQTARLLEPFQKLVSSIDQGTFRFPHILTLCFSQSVTYQYREFPVPGIFHFLVVSEPVSGKIGTGKKSRNRYRKKSRNRYRKNLVPEPVSEKFGTGKSLGTETFIFVAKI